MVTKLANKSLTYRLSREESGARRTRRGSIWGNVIPRRGNLREWGRIQRGFGGRGKVEVARNVRICKGIEGSGRFDGRNRREAEERRKEKDEEEIDRKRDGEDVEEESDDGGEEKVEREKRGRG
jgi:hypothetical protein